MVNQTNGLQQRILETALQLAEARSWEEVHLHSIADELGITLDQIRRHYPQKDDIAEAWFDRADHAVLSERASEEFLALNSRERLRQIIMTWLGALAPHRRVTRQMLLYKLEFGHVHLLALGIMRISRTVQWFREAAYQGTTDLRRVVEETALTSIYLVTFARWLYDDSAGSEATARLLDRLLRRAEFCAHTLGRFIPTPYGRSYRTTPKPVHNRPTTSDSS